MFGQRDKVRHKLVPTRKGLVDTCYKALDGQTYLVVVVDGFRFLATTDQWEHDITILDGPNPKFIKEVKHAL